MKIISSKPSSSATSIKIITDLPRELLRDILSRLSVSNLVKCRLVCRKLRQIITEDPEFARLHFSRSSEQFLMRRGVSATLHLLELERFLDYDECPRAEFPLPIPSGDLVLLNSCNGFLCLGREPNFDPCIVFNPVTGEYLNLPGMVPEGRDEVISGFGYSSKTYQYKVVRLIYLQVCEEGERVTQVITLGEKSWRTTGLSPKLPKIISETRPVYYQNGVFLNGFFHWLFTDDDSRSNYIVSFDFDNEKFGTVPLPSDLGETFGGDYWNYTGMGVLEGCLYVNDSEMWMMENYGVQGSWTLVNSISSIILCCSSLVKRLDDRTLLLNVNNTDLIWYKTITTPESTYCFLDRTFFPNIPDGVSIRTVAHVPSFVSLKDIMKGRKNALCHMQVHRVLEQLEHQQTNR